MCLSEKEEDRREQHDEKMTILTNISDQFNYSTLIQACDKAAGAIIIQVYPHKSLYGIWLCIHIGAHVHECKAYYKEC